MIARGLALCLLSGVCAGAQVLWQEPRPTTTLDWTWGPGGEKMAPVPPYQFVKEKFNGTNPKVEVQDAAGRRWTVKFGAEVHADTFAARFVSALGYGAEPTYYVPTGQIQGVHDLNRARHFVSKSGSFQEARFKLDQPHAKKDAENRAWSWTDNPFAGTRELGGLKVLVMLMSNWDTKDSRDGQGSNNEIIQPVAGSSEWYAVTDWGASLGKSGGFFKRDRWDWNGYRMQNPTFVRLASNGALDWGFKGKHGQDITAGVGLEDVSWLVPYLSRITDEDLKAGFISSGASVPVAQEYTRLVRDRIGQLRRLAQPQNAQRAAK